MSKVWAICAWLSSFVHIWDRSQIEWVIEKYKFSPLSFFLHNCTNTIYNEIIIITASQSIQTCCLCRCSGCRLSFTSSLKYNIECTLLYTTLSHVSYLYVYTREKQNIIHNIFMFLNANVSSYEFVVIFIVSHANRSGKCLWLVSLHDTREWRRVNYYHFWSEGMHMKNYHFQRITLVLCWFCIEKHSCWIEKEGRKGWLIKEQNDALFRAHINLTYRSWPKWLFKC